MSAVVFAKYASTWQDVKSVYVKTGGQWRTTSIYAGYPLLTSSHVKNGAIWTQMKTLNHSPPIDIWDLGGNPATVITYYANGQFRWYANNLPEDHYIADNWVVPYEVGTGNSYEIYTSEDSSNNGVHWNDNPSWQSLGTNRSFWTTGLPPIYQEGSSRLKVQIRDETTSSLAVVVYITASITYVP